MAWDIKGGPWPDGSTMWCKRLRGGRFGSWKSVVFSGLGSSNQKVFATYYVHQFGHPPPNSASACALACRMDLLMIASTRYTQFRKRISEKGHYLWLWNCFQRPCVRCCHIWLTPINPGTILWWYHVAWGSPIDKMMRWVCVLRRNERDVSGDVSFKRTSCWLEESSWGNDDCRE